MSTSIGDIENRVCGKQGSLGSGHQEEAECAECLLVTLGSISVEGKARGQEGQKQPCCKAGLTTAAGVQN